MKKDTVISDIGPAPREIQHAMWFISVPVKTACRLGLDVSYHLQHLSRGMVALLHPYV